MTLPTRPTYLMNVYEKLGSPLLSAAVEAIERESLMNNGAASTRSETEEAERIAALLKSSAELGFALSRQVDLRMLDATDADGIRLTLATIAAPLIANLYRVNGRTPTTPEIDRMVAAMQAVTVFADNYNAAADTSARIQSVDQDFAPMDTAQVQLTLMNALMPAVNAVCTFSFGQPEKTLLQDVINRLTATSQKIRNNLFAGLSERDSLRAEISLMRATANIYSQAHFMEMSKLMFLDETQRDSVNLTDRLAELWRIVETRLLMVRVLAEHLVGVKSTASTGTSGTIAPAQTATTPAAIDSPFMMPTTPPSTPAAPATSPAATGGSPFSAFTTPKTTPEAAQQSAPPATPVSPVATTPAAPADKSNPLSMFAKKEAAGGQG